MSNMISSGLYNITNAMYPDMFFGGVLTSNDTCIGSSLGYAMVQVDVKDEDTRLATLYIPGPELYVGFNMEGHVATGYTDPQVLQLSSGYGDTLVIQQQNTDEVCYIQEDVRSGWTPIYVGPAPEDDGKYWIFDKVDGEY
ncbi:hypothetical protein BDR04DRAFT_1102923 [Suillus decipiens]|nr:hypothetical protein BDR04DRAFT_1102923 [Suillus decipiens]